MGDSSITTTIYTNSLTIHTSYAHLFFSYSIIYYYYDLRYEDHRQWNTKCALTVAIFELRTEKGTYYTHINTILAMFTNMV